MVICEWIQRITLIFWRPYKLKKIRFSAGFLLLCSWLLYGARSGIVLQGFASCLLHELGHLLALRRFNIGVTEIRVSCFGAKIKLARTPSYLQELFVAAAGPAVNLLLACFFCSTSFGTVFAGINLSLAVFNLLPISQLDGARILRCAANLLLCQRRADQLSNVLSALTGIVFLFFGLYAAFVWQNVTLLLMCIWVLKTTSMEKYF